MGAEPAPGEMIGTGLSTGSNASSASSITVKHVDHSEDAAPSVLQIGMVPTQLVDLEHQSANYKAS